MYAVNIGHILDNTYYNIPATGTGIQGLLRLNGGLRIGD